jgi:hypothetical protein
MVLIGISKLDGSNPSTRIIMNNFWKKLLAILFFLVGAVSKLVYSLICIDLYHFFFVYTNFIQNQAMCWAVSFFLKISEMYSLSFGTNLVYSNAALCGMFFLSIVLASIVAIILYTNQLATDKVKKLINKKFQKLSFFCYYTLNEVFWFSFMCIWLGLIKACVWSPHTTIPIHGDFLGGTFAIFIVIAVTIKIFKIILKIFIFVTKFFSFNFYKYFFNKKFPSTH